MSNPKLLIECLIERDGPTTVTLHCHQYEFKKNGAGHSVCEVALKEHRAHLLKLGDFRIYDDNSGDSKKIDKNQKT